MANDKGRYRQFVSEYRKRLPNGFRRFDLAEIPAPEAKDIPIEAFLTLSSFIIHYFGKSPASFGAFKCRSRWRRRLPAHGFPALSRCTG
jgi:hypothetical protein